MPITMESVFSNTLMLGFMVVTVIFVAAVVAAITWGVSQWKKYRQFDIHIFERDGFGQLKRSYDTAGIFVDNKTKNKRLWLKANKVGLDPNNIPWIQSGNKKIVYLLRTGLKNFRYIKININEPIVKFVVGEEDVNWSINAYEKQKKLFQSSILLQILPYAALGIVAIIILIIFMYLFKDVGGWFSQMNQLAQIMKETAVALANAKSGTAIMPGG